MRVYLDTCAVQRPLDDKHSLRVATESEAILNIIAAIQEGKIKLVVSSVLIYETSLIVRSVRRLHSEAVLGLATLSVKISPEMKKRSQHFARFGIKPMDALHLASAESADCDFFCTCDDRFFQACKRPNRFEVYCGYTYRIGGET
jgi:predicted nucleic acid-binding protein